MSNPVTEPLVSVIIVTWNSAAHLPHCLAALKEQTFTDFEVIVVDNGSQDACVSGLADRYAPLNLRVIQLPSNIGFAPANNQGARQACGRWLALLNADAYPEPGWLDELLKAAALCPPRSFFTSRQLQAGDPSRLDGEGDVYHVSGLAWRKNYSRPVYEASAVQPVFSSCGAASMYPRQEFLEAGGFDQDYFSYFEDVDLGFRLRLQGLQCFFVPGAVVHHVGAASTMTSQSPGRRSDFMVYHGHRNLEWTYAKDMPASLFWLYLPLHLLVSASYLVYFSLQGQASAIWRAKRDALMGLGPALTKRRLVQQKRAVPVRVVHEAMSRSLWELIRHLAGRGLPAATSGTGRDLK